MLKANYVSLSAVSNVNGADIATFNASFAMGQGGNYNVSKTAQSIAVYEANKAVCDSDYAEFEFMVREFSDYFLEGNEEAGTDDALS